MPPKKKEEEPQGPDETEVRQSAVIASTFANLELQTTKKTLQQYVEFYNGSRAEVQRLQREVEDRDKDNIKVVKHLREELDKKEQEKRNQMKASDEELDGAQRRFNSERKQLLVDLKDKDEEISGLKQQVEELQVDLDALQAFKRERQEMHLEMSRFKDRQKEETARYEAEISRLRFQSLEEKVRLKAEERTMSAKFDEEVNDRAMQLLDGRTREIHSENYMLLQDKILLEKELESLSAEHRDMQVKFGTKRRDVELLSLGEAELAKKSVKQTRQIQESGNKVKVLESNLKNVVEEYEIKLNHLENTSSLQISTLTVERDRAYKNAEARHKELVKMRQLSRQLVSQRSELETFFNEALEFVKSEISKERAHYLRTKEAPLPITVRSQQPKQKKSTAGSQHPFFQQDNFEPISLGIREQTGDDGTAKRESAPNSAPGRSHHGANLPPIGSAKERADSSGSDSRMASRGLESASQQQVGSSTMGAKMKTDISNLNWTDKERVLRILFAKINSASQARHETQEQRVPLPPPSVPTLTEKPHQEDTFLTGQAPDRIV